MIRGVPGGRSAGLAINAQHPTRKCEIDETAVDGDDGGQQEDDPGIPKIPGSVCNFPIYRPGKLRGATGGVRRGWPLTPTAQCGTDNKIDETAVDGRRAGGKADPGICKTSGAIRNTTNLPFRCAAAGLRGAVGGAPRGRSLTPNTQRGNDN